MPAHPRRAESVAASKQTKSRKINQNEVKDTHGAPPDKKKDKDDAVPTPSTMLDGLPGVRTTGTRHTGKLCSFLCGSEFGFTPDPVQPSRPSIRWFYELAQADAAANDKGACCYWCGRAWMEYAAFAEEPTREAFQRAIAIDGVKLKSFQDCRGRGCERARKKSTREKRRGIHGSWLPARAMFSFWIGFGDVSGQILISLTGRMASEADLSARHPATPQQYVWCDVFHGSHCWD